MFLRAIEAAHKVLEVEGNETTDYTGQNWALKIVTCHLKLKSGWLSIIDCLTLKSKAEDNLTSSTGKLSEELRSLKDILI